jgi:hypothetical protein
LRRENDCDDLPDGAIALLRTKRWFWDGTQKLDQRRPGSYRDFTLLELCGLPPDPSCDGKSIVPLLRNPMARWESPALMTYGRGNHAVRSSRWRYIRYADGSEELYDHRSDPNE